MKAHCTATVLLLCSMGCSEELDAPEYEACEIGVILGADEATIHTCGLVNTTIETWIDLWSCDDQPERMEWSRRVVVSTDFDKRFGGSYSFSFSGIDERDAKAGYEEACWYSWSMLETYKTEDDDWVYTGEIIANGQGDINLSL